MSKFSINDAVSFINEKQDGIVKAIKAGGICVVEIEDGFEIDALETELVLIRKEKTIPEVEKPLKEKEEKQFIPAFTKNIPALADGIWLVICPSTEGMVLTGPADYYIVNNSDYDILFAASFKSGRKLKGIMASKILTETELYITTIKREEAIDLEGWNIQMIFHRENEFEPHSTVTKELPVLFPDLSSSNSKLNAPYAFCKYDYLGGRASGSGENDELFADFSIKDLQSALGSNIGSGLRKEKSQAKMFPGPLEVDLHIEELTERFTGLSNAEIITIQLNYFRKKLDEALYKKAYKIIFIHGVGNGVLKSAIREELTSHNLHFTDGAYERYGGGATEVIL